MDISLTNSIVKLYKGTADAFGGSFFTCYNIKDFNSYNFNVDSFELYIDRKSHRCAFLDLTIEGVSPYDFDAAHASLAIIFSPTL